MSLPNAYIIEPARLRGGSLAIPPGDFLPTALPNLSLWLRANTIPGNDGDVISTWSDESGNANHATSTGTARPTLKKGVVNGRPVLRFDGSNDILTLTAALTLTNFSIYIVTQSTGDQMLMSRAGLNRQVRVGDSGANTISLMDGTNNPASAALGISRANWVFYGWQGNGTTASFYEVGTARGTGTINTSLSLDSIGYYAAGPSNYAAADIAEIIIYSTAHEAATRQRVEGYVAATYGLRSSLPGGHTYASAAAPLGYTGTVTFYAAATSGGAVTTLNSVKLTNGIVTGWTQT